MTRREDWESRLYAVVESVKDRPYQLGVHDCLRFACDAIESMTGVDYWPQFAGLYGDHRAAMRLIRKHGRTFADAVSGVLGRQPQPVLLSQRGDLLLYRDTQDHLGVCLGATVAVLGPSGLAQVPITHAGLRASWRV